MSYDSEILKLGKERIDIELFKKIERIPEAGRTELEKEYVNGENSVSVEMIESGINDLIDLMQEDTDLGDYTMLSIPNFFAVKFKYFSGTLLLTNGGRTVCRVPIEEYEWLEDDIFIDLPAGYFKYENYDSYDMDINSVVFEAYSEAEVNELKDLGIVSKTNIDVFLEYMEKIGYSKEEALSLDMMGVINAEPKELAEVLTKAAELKSESLNRILAEAPTDITIEYKISDDHLSFDEDPPVKPTKPAYPTEPQRSDSKYQTKSFSISRLFKSDNGNEEQRLTDLFNEDYRIWEDKVEEIDAAYEKSAANYEEKLQEWKDRQDEFNSKLKELEERIERLRTGAPKGDPEAVEVTCEMLYEKLKVPFNFNFKGQAKYDKDSNTLVTDVFLPSREDIPNIKAIKYNNSSNQYSETLLSDSYMESLYDNVIYQLTLVVIRQLFNSKGVLPEFDTVVFNGKVETIDKANGKIIKPCILSVSVTRDDVWDIIPEHVDAKEWFKSMKGVSATKLALATAVPPIATVDTNDKRFVESYEVANNLNESTNLASMDWKDFENLIRELFEKEFGGNGGEVKVTQASRDGGVDAIAFDPDPIKGGKIVIQAKRYTNTVGVSAVRDLYGTVMNEGANKGILVTTSGYGNDAYEFAKGKPITLLDGANLLYLLEKYGYKVRIDLNEAKNLNK